MIVRSLRARRRRGAALLLAALLVVLAVAPNAAAQGEAASAPVRAWPDDAAPGALLVTSADELDALRAVVERQGGPLAGAEVRRVAAGTALVQVAAGAESAAAARLRAEPAVRSVEPDRVRSLGLGGKAAARVAAAVRSAEENGRRPARGWAVTETHLDELWSRTTGARGVRVGLVDSGVDAEHPGLAETVVEQAEAATGVVEPRGPGVDNDTCDIGHGTAVAGLLAAAHDSARDPVRGVAPGVALIDVAVSSARAPETCASVPDSAVLAALDHLVEHPNGPVDVINLSLGSPQGYCPEPYAETFAAARRADVLVVAAAGTGPRPHIPASCPDVVSVSAFGPGGDAPAYSPANSWVSLAGPGGDTSSEPESRLETLAPGGATTEVFGTSFAAPMVSGVAALLRSLRPELGVPGVRSALLRTAERPDGPSEALGWGRLRADRAADYISQREQVPEPPPEPFFPVLRRHRPPSGEAPSRVRGEVRPTEPVEQAVAISRGLFRDQGAVHAVLARADRIPDALSGAALGLGVGPLLFTSDDGMLDPKVRAELSRVLPPGGRVYLLGGEAAFGPAARRELEALGYAVRRLSGPDREATAAAVAFEVGEQVALLGRAEPDMVLVANRSSWVDAASAGALGARFGVPLLLTPGDDLHPEAARALATLRPERVGVVGGRERVSEAVAAAAARAAGAEEAVRFAGADRHATAAAIAEEVLRREVGLTPRLAVAINLRGDRAMPHALAAAALVGAHSGVLVPVEGEHGDELPEVAAELLARLVREPTSPTPAGESDTDADDAPAVVGAGGMDLVSDEALAEIAAALSRDAEGTGEGEDGDADGGEGDDHA